MRGAPRSYVIRVTFLRILGPVHDVVTKGPRGLSEHNIVTRTVIGLPPEFDVGCGEEDNHPRLFAAEEPLNVRLNPRSASAAAIVTFRDQKTKEVGRRFNVSQTTRAS